MIQEKSSNTNQAKEFSEKQKELGVMVDAYDKMLKYKAEYGKKLGGKNTIKKVQEIAKKCKLPIIYPSTGQKELKEVPSFTLNGFFERFKSGDRWELFTKSYRNIPMFYERNISRWDAGWYSDQDHSWYLKQEHRWYLEQEKKIEDFFHEDFLEKDTQIISGKNPSIFKKDSYGDRVELGKQNSFDIFGKGRSAFYNRNEFIEGICKKKRNGRNDVRDFLKKRLLPIDEFDLRLNSFLRSALGKPPLCPSCNVPFSSSDIDLIMEKFHSAIKNIGIKLIKCDGKDCLWYEDYAIIPSISIDLSEIGYTAPYYLSMSFFLDRYYYNYPNNNNVIWQYIFLQQSGLLRSARRMYNSQPKILFFKYFYDSISPSYQERTDTEGHRDISYYYPIFQVGEGGTIKVIDTVPLCSDKSKILNLMNIGNDIYINNKEQLPEDWLDIFEFINHFFKERRK